MWEGGSVGRDRIRRGGLNESKRDGDWGLKGGNIVTVEELVQIGR